MKLFTIFAVSLSCISLIDFGQSGGKKLVISGFVTNLQQKPVKEAIIYIDNKKTRFSTDDSGFYKIIISPTVKKIMISSVNFGNSEVEINGKTSINFILNGSGIDSTSSSKNKQQKSRLNSRKTMTKASGPEDQKHKYSSYTNIYEMIRGELPGVRVNGTNIVVQGNSTFGGSNEALLVVDGIPTDQINDIFPADVKSIDVLDGARAAGYGMRGANGVIVITTLRGSSKKQ